LFSFSVSSFSAAASFTFYSARTAASLAALSCAAFSSSFAAASLSSV